MDARRDTMSCEMMWMTILLSSKDKLVLDLSFVSASISGNIELYIIEASLFSSNSTMNSVSIFSSMPDTLIAV